MASSTLRRLNTYHTEKQCTHTVSHLSDTTGWVYACTIFVHYIGLLIGWDWRLRWQVLRFLLWYFTYFIRFMVFNRKHWTVLSCFKSNVHHNTDWWVCYSLLKKPFIYNSYLSYNKQWTICKDKSHIKKSKILSFVYCSCIVYVLFQLFYLIGFVFFWFKCN